jgi:multiple sugar transport system substrate-binding protein/raffinose/stachyose/melibiose transport system substrate-binding protein
MKSINHLLVFISLIALLALIAAQCASPEEELVESVELADPVELNYVAFFYGDAADNDTDQKLIEQYEADHPQIEIAYSTYVFFASPPEDYLTDVSPPDIMTLALDKDTSYFVDQGLLLDLSDVWNQPTLADAYPPDFRALGEWNGNQYFLPVGHAWMAIYYNKEIFSRYNLEPPTTWDEFLTVANTLQANDITPIALGAYRPVGAVYWLDYLNMRLNGPKFHAEFVQGQHQFNDPEIREVFEVWKDLLDKNFFPDNAHAKRLPESIIMVTEGKAGMVLADSGSISEQPEKIRDKLDFFRFPIINPEIPVGEITPTGGYVIPAGALHPEEAMGFLAYIASAEGQAVMLQQSDNADGLPVNQKIDTALLSSEARQGWALIRDADQVVQPYASNLSALETGLNFGPFMRAFRKFLRDPKNLEIVLDELEEVRRQAFDQ